MKLINAEVRLEPTNRCNQYCIMCPRDKMTRPHGEMSMDLYKRILAQCYGAGAEIVSLENYGEPFADPWLLERAEYAKRLGMKVYTITNASLIDKQVADKALKLFDIIRISMYATTPDTYKKVHRSFEYNKVVKNIDYILKAKRDCKIHMYFLFLEENKFELTEWLRRYELVADKVAVWMPHNWSDGRDYRKPKGEKQSCNRPFTGSLQVQWDGKVVPCCFDYDNAMVLGDFNVQSLEEIMKSKRYNDLRDAHTKKEFYRYPFCDQCDQLYKDESVLIYTNIKNAGVGKQNTNYFNL